MTEETPTVGAGESAGAGGTPSQPVSQTPQPAIEGDVTKLLGEFGGKLDSLSKELRGLQGRQDKSEGRFSDFQKQLAKFNQYKAQDYSDDEALAEMEADDRYSQWQGNIERKLDELAARIAGGGTQANDSNAVAKVFEALGLDLKDVRVASALARKYDNPDQVELAAYRLQRELASTPNPSQAQAASLQGGTSSGNSEVNNMIQELARLQKQPTPNRDRIRELTKTLDARGWA